MCDTAIKATAVPLGAPPPGTKVKSMYLAIGIGSGSVF